MGQVPTDPCALRVQKMYMKGGYSKFLTLFWPPEVGLMANLHSKISDFDFLVFILIFLHEITLLAIDIDNIGCLELFLPP